MRVLVSILFSAAAVLAQAPAVLAPTAQVPENLSIPARLSKTLDTNKCKAGDLVEMRTLEPVLITHGLVMPENAKLQGRVLGAGSSQNNQPSWMVLVLERAEWKQHSIPLHAFVSAQITLKLRAVGPGDSAFENQVNSRSNLQTRHGAALSSASGRQVPGSPHALQDATVQSSDAQQSDYHGADDLRIAPGKNGIVFLVSPKPHLKLSSGAMFMLRNQATADQKQSEATKVASAQ